VHVRAPNNERKENGACYKDATRQELGTRYSNARQIKGIAIENV
jgi:hypothetical protein